MKKLITTAIVLAATISGAATFATANNGSDHTIAAAPIALSDIDTHGIKNCEQQVWPRIDSICLSHAAVDGGEIREARLVEM